MKKMQMLLASALVVVSLSAKAGSIVKTYCFYEAKICLDSPTEVKLIQTSPILSVFRLFDIEVDGKIFKMYSGSHSKAPVCTSCPNPRLIKSQDKTVWSFVKDNIVIYRELLIVPSNISFPIQIHAWIQLNQFDNPDKIDKIFGSIRFFDDWKLKQDTIREK